MNQSLLLFHMEKIRFCSGIFRNEQTSFLISVRVFCNLTAHANRQLFS